MRHSISSLDNQIQSCILSALALDQKNFTSKVPETTHSTHLGGRETEVLHHIPADWLHAHCAVRYACQEAVCIFSLDKGPDEKNALISTIVLYVERKSDYYAVDISWLRKRDLAH